MSDPAEKSLSVLHAENQEHATTASKKRWGTYKKWMKWVPIAVFFLGVWWLYRSPISPVNTNPGGLLTATAPTLSPEQREAAHKEAVEETRRQAELASAATATAPPPERTKAADVRKDCGGDYAKLTNCRNVYFGRNEKYFVESAKGICPVSDPNNAGIWESLGGDQYNFIPFSDEGVRVTFFEMKKGETFGGYTCK